MRLSKYFLPLLKETPADASIISHQYMLRAGMIKQVTSGVYAWLPIGLKVLQNIERVIRFHMNQIGGIEVLFPTIQPTSLWQESGRYDSYGKETLRIYDRHGAELIYGPTAEEIATDIFRSYIQSYKELPKNLYQISWKFRDEIRPRFGVMRGREFLMKDAYTFDIDMDSFTNTYNKIFKAYIDIFKHLGLNVIPVKADNGVIGGEMSHEFHVLAESGESEIFYDKRFEILCQDPDVNIEDLKKLYAAASEKHDPENCPVESDHLAHKRGIEVGHIFHFGDKYSKSMNALVNNDYGKKVTIQMGSHGIGVSRLVAAIIEASHDEKGIIWPEVIAPFKVSIINLKPESPSCEFLCDMIYASFAAENVEILYDDTEERAGVKFSKHDLIGSPWQIIVGPKNASEDLVELKHRRTGEIEVVHPEVAIKKILGFLNSF